MSETLFDPQDFKSIELRITVHNLATKRESAQNEILEFLSDSQPGMVIEVPANFCTKGQQLRLEVEVVNAGRPLQFKAVAEAKRMESNQSFIYEKGEEVEHTASPTDTITVTLTEFDQEGWNDLHSLFGKRQNEIEVFFNSVKGR